MRVTLDEVEHVWADAELLYDEAEVERAIDETAERLGAEISGDNPLVLTLMTGGMIFAAKLFMRFKFPAQIDYVHATRYEERLDGCALKWKVKPAVSLAGRTVLLVDDILDEGDTLYQTLKACESLGAARLLTSVLIDKKHGRKTHEGFRADYTALTVEDRYVFGYGMDYKGYWRNAPGIYAVKT